VLRSLAPSTRRFAGRLTALGAGLSEGLRSQVVCRTIDVGVDLEYEAKNASRDRGMRGQASKLDEFGLDSPRRPDFANVGRKNRPTRAQSRLARYAGVFG
jgi:hypothetical protein